MNAENLISERALIQEAGKYVLCLLPTSPIAIIIVNGLYYIVTTTKVAASFTLQPTHALKM